MSWWRLGGWSLRRKGIGRWVGRCELEGCWGCLKGLGRSAGGKQGVEVEEWAAKGMVGVSRSACLCPPSGVFAIRARFMVSIQDENNTQPPSLLPILYRFVMTRSTPPGVKVIAGVAFIINLAFLRSSSSPFRNGGRLNSKSRMKSEVVATTSTSANRRPMQLEDRQRRGQRRLCSSRPQAGSGRG
jgi:hypothetical protein